MIVSEPNPFRAKLALRLGAVAALDPLSSDLADVVSAATKGEGADCAIETSGAPGAAERAMAVLRPLGRMALLAWDVPVRLPPLIPKGLGVDGCWHWNHQRDSRSHVVYGPQVEGVLGPDGDPFVPARPSQ